MNFIAPFRGSILPMEASPDEDQRSAEEYSHAPNVADVLRVKQLIFQKSGLPLELVDAIIDYAEYWPCTTIPMMHAPVKVQAGRNQNQLILRSFPLGYAPNQTSPSYRIVSRSAEDLDAYTSMSPLPWLEKREVPNDATEEVLRYWLSESLCRSEHPCKKIVFNFKSHDQGWGGDADCQGTYRGAFSWFDVGLERFSATRDANPVPPPKRGNVNPLRICIEDSEEKPITCILRTIIPVTVPTSPSDLDNSDLGQLYHPLCPDANALQKNRTATRQTHEYTITWSASDNVSPDSPEADALEAQGRGRDTISGNFVRSLVPGDVITVWAKARFAGWSNHIESMKMDVYWAI